MYYRHQQNNIVYKLLDDFVTHSISGNPHVLFQNKSGTTFIVEKSIFFSTFVKTNLNYFAK